MEKEVLRISIYCKLASAQFVFILGSINLGWYVLAISFNSWMLTSFGKETEPNEIFAVDDVVDGRSGARQLHLQKSMLY